MGRIEAASALAWQRAARRPPSAQRARSCHRCATTGAGLPDRGGGGPADCSSRGHRLPAPIEPRASVRRSFPRQPSNPVPGCGVCRPHLGGVRAAGVDGGAARGCIWRGSGPQPQHPVCCHCRCCCCRCRGVFLKHTPPISVLGATAPLYAHLLLFTLPPVLRRPLQHLSVQQGAALWPAH